MRREAVVRLGAGLLLACVAGSLFSGCDGEGAPVVAELPRWRLEEELRYAEDESYPLSAVRAVAQAPTGEIFVADARTPAVLRYGPDGRITGTVGREGEGPGEFAAVSRIGVHERALWVADFRLGRVSRFSLDGTHEETWTAGAETPAGAGGDGTPFAVLRSGAVLTMRSSGPRGERAIIGLVPPSKDARVLTEIDLSARFWNIQIPGSGPSSSSIPQPLGSHDIMRAWAGGLVVVDRGPPADPDSATYGVVWLEEDAEPLRTAVAYEPRPVDDERIEAGLARYTSTGLPRRMARIGVFPSEDAVLRAARESMVIPEWVPPVRGEPGPGLESRSVLVEPNGTAWLHRATATPEGVAIWDVVAAAGREASAEVPPGVELVAVGDGRAWGVVRDRLNVPTIVRYRIVDR